MSGSDNHKSDEITTINSRLLVIEAIITVTISITITGTYASMLPR